MDRGSLNRLPEWQNSDSTEGYLNRAGDGKILAG